MSTLLFTCLRCKVGYIRLSLNISLLFDTLTNLFQFFSILSDLKCCRNTFSSCTNHLWNAKPRSSQKRAIKKICFFKLQNTFSFFHFNPSYFINAFLFSFFFFQIEKFKLIWNCHFKFYKSSCNSKYNKVIFKDFLKGSKIGYELFDQGFSIKTTPLFRGS